MSAPESSLSTRFIKLEPLAGPPIESFTIAGDKPCSLGRQGICDVQLPDRTVSRRHAVVSFKDDVWFMTDLESRHGTYINGVRLEVNTPTRIGEGNLIRLGPWTFRVRTSESAPSTLPTTNDVASSSHRVQRVPKQELKTVPHQERLNLLIEFAGALPAAKDEKTLGQAMIQVVVRGTSFARAAWIRKRGADVELLGYHGPGGAEAPSTSFAFSRSLLNAAEQSKGMVRLSSESQQNPTHSMMDLGIHSAICIPVFIDETIDSFLYLDARAQEGAGQTARVESDSAAFCDAVGRIVGPALGNLNRRHTEEQNEEILREVQAAGSAQKLLLPPPHGQLGQFAYYMRLRPGRIVAGDLFNIVELPGGKVAAYLGDVAGKGVGAAINMATTQTMLDIKLRESLDPAVALNAVNQVISRQLPDGKFVSLWCGVFDAQNGIVRFVDAGHGHWLMRTGTYKPQRVTVEGGTLLGVAPETPYVAEQRPFPVGSRLILFSDGVVEQPAPDGEQFGLDRMIDTLAAADSTDAEINGIFDALKKFAGTSALADDVTVASIERREGSTAGL